MKAAIKRIAIIVGISMIGLLIIISLDVPPIWAHCIGWIGGSIYCLLTNDEE
jgi:hypothetical protein